VPGGRRAEHPVADDQEVHDGIIPGTTAQSQRRSRFPAPAKVAVDDLFIRLLAFVAYLLRRTGRM